ncbi:MAG: 2Fe-2S iron-sulfur cluster-binding protein [Gammaproteobacteria bacterium]|jgi:ferredoxin
METSDRIFRIAIADSNEQFTCKDGQNVLLAMERLGRKGIPVGCRGGGCGICRVQVLGGGAYRTLKMSRAQVSEVDEAAGVCLACKLLPEGDLTIRPLGLLQKQLSK